MKQNILFYLIALLFFPLYEMQAAHQPEFSTAGFYELANSGREVYSMNPAWRFHKGAATGAEATDFNDRIHGLFLRMLFLLPYTVKLPVKF